MGVNSSQHLNPTHDKEETEGQEKMHRGKEHPRPGEGDICFQRKRKVITTTHEEKDKQYSKQMQYLSHQRDQILESTGLATMQRKIRLRKSTKKNENTNQAIRTPETRHYV